MPLTRIGPHAISSPPFRRPPKSGTAGRRLQLPASFRRHVLPPRVAAGSVHPHPIPIGPVEKTPSAVGPVAAGRHTPLLRSCGVARRSFSNHAHVRSHIPVGGGARQLWGGFPYSSLSLASAGQRRPSLPRSDHPNP
jgi:hypothetical protein